MFRIALIHLWLLASLRAERTSIESMSFQPRSVPSGPALFTTLESEQTGVRTVNTYHDPQMWGEKYAIFALGSTGTGVAVGDYDGDGLADLYVVNKCDPNRLYRNRGDFHFEDVTESAGVAFPSAGWNQAAAFADVNNDGLLDLYVTRIGAPNLLFLNRGKGRFEERGSAAGLAVVDASGTPAFCDYDRDGWLDLYLQTSLLDTATHPNGQRDRLFHNRRDGTFDEVTTAAGIYGDTHGHSATWWDFNNDGWPDLYVANDFAGPDQLYRNNGDGTFTDVLVQTVPHLPLFAMGSDLGDVNNDGRVDLMVADMLPTSVEKDLRTMVEFRRIVPESPNPKLPPQLVRNALYLNTGLDRVLEAAALSGLQATDWTWSVRFEDLDNDGRLDAFLTNGMVRDFFDSDMRERVANWPLAERIRAVKAMPILTERNLVFRNLGDLQFENTSAAWGLNHLGVSFGAAFGDLDGDGDLDLVVVNYQSAPTICRNDSQEGHSAIVELRGTASNRFGIGATVRIETAAGAQIRPLVVARGYMSSSEPIAHFGLGRETRIRRLTVNWPSGREQTFENLAADRRYTITEPDGSENAGGVTSPRDGETKRGEVTTPTFSPIAAQKKTQFETITEQAGLSITSSEPAIDELKDQPLLPIRQNRLGPSIALGDVNGDGRADVVLGGAMGESLQFALAANDGSFVPQHLKSKTGAADAGLVFFDADGDGVDDLLLTKGGVALPANDPGYQPALVMNRRGGRMQEAPPGTLPKFTSSAGPAIAADFNGDGRLDVFIGGRVVPGAYGEIPRSALWINRAGRFTDETENIAPGLTLAGLVAAALATDVDRDGWIDLVIATQWGEVQCWRNNGGKQLENRTAPFGFDRAGSGWWNSLAAGDFNHDGRLDYVAGNLGLNTPYAASRESPALLLRGDFEGSGHAQLIEAIDDSGVLRPRRGRTSLVAAMPSLARKFPTFAGYARASLVGLFGEEALRSATRLQATEFRSGVFMSQPDGTFRFEPLPRIAQIAPVFGLATGDFDGDGNVDICLVQNSYAPIPELGRFDGGLGQYLRGDGHGGWIAVTGIESGLIVPGDGKALVTLDHDNDGWPDLIATRNNDSVLAFHNAQRAGGKSFALVLEGPAGNPHAVGAGVRVRMADGTSQMAEVHAGGGYLSQSEAKCFFGYNETNPPVEIRIRWPFGGETVHPFAEAALVVIAAPR